MPLQSPNGVCMPPPIFVCYLIHCCKFGGENHYKQIFFGLRLLVLTSCQLSAMRNKFFFLWLMLWVIQSISAPKADTGLLLKPDRLFDGEQMHNNWSVLVQNNIIIAVGETSSLRPALPYKSIELKGTTLLPGLIEGHSHLFLHPYNETRWDEQVVNESRAERNARAVVHANKTLMAGFTTVRDLGTEGLFYDDAGLKTAIEKGIVPGPRIIAATRAIVATGTYGPRAKNTMNKLIKGAAEADGIDDLIKEARRQIGKGADVVKVYADYRWGIDKKIAEPTYSLEELKAVVAAAASSGRKVAAHASTQEGMRRAVLAGISTIEHGDEGTAEIFDLMVANKTAYCPTLSATEALCSYEGWKKDSMPEPERVTIKKKAFSIALQKGVTICMGGDVGVYAHGDNAREMEAMVAYGMKPVDVLKSATSVNADMFGYGDKIGRIKKGLLADIIAVKGNPAEHISDVRKTVLVMKDGAIYVNNSH